MIDIEIRVTNTDEPGEVALDSSQPVVGSKLYATLSDQDGVDLSGSNMVSWTVQNSSGHPGGHLDQCFG